MKTNQLSRVMAGNARQRIQSNVMHWAHANWQTATWSNRLKAAWAVNTIRRYMQHGLVKFVFTKKDGTLRQACGTLCPKFIPADKRPTGARQARIEQGIEQPNYTAIAYYDLEKDEWRSFAIDSFEQLGEVFLINS